MSLKTKEVLARMVADKYDGNKNAALNLDPEKIYAIVDLFIQLINMFKECKPAPDGQTLKASLTNPTAFGKMRARKVVRESMGGALAYRRNRGEDLLDAILEVGSQTPVQELDQLIVELETDG